jgi:LysM repeat protein
VSEKPILIKMFGVLLLILAGCTSTPMQENTTPSASTQTPAITPYLTSTLIETVAPTATHAPTPTLPPLPTPTPYLYTIVQGDTMIGIATYFGITYDQLSLANPEVNPNFLSVGTQLIIPLPTAEADGEDTSEPASPEVLPLQTGEVFCYPVRSGGMWCYLPVTNTTSSPAENITGVVRLYNELGEETASQTAHSMLNLLSPGGVLPLAAYFSPPIPNWSSGQGQLVSAVEANQSEIRYLPGDLRDLNSAPISSDQLGFQVSGNLVYSLPTKEDGSLPEWSYVWVLVTAYDSDGAIVGVRRWEADTDQLGTEVSFNVEVFSLGKPIETVQVLSEARITQP